MQIASTVDSAARKDWLERIGRIRARPSSVRIVPYSPKYRDGVVEIAHEMHANSIYHDMPLDEEKVVRQLAASGSIVPDRFFRIAVIGDEVLGGFYGHVHKTFFCDELLAQDMGWWVKSTARGSVAAVLMLAEFEDWARTQGARKVMVGQSTAINIETTTKLFKACGFRVIGYNTVKDL